jgi:hypothetical protein
VGRAQCPPHFSGHLVDWGAITQHDDHSITRRSTTVGEVIDSRYLPFDEETLGRHLAKPDKSYELITPEESDGVAEVDSGGIDHYLKSADAYHWCFQQKNLRRDKNRADKHPRQIEKDEKFWTAACLLSLHIKGTAKDWIDLMGRAFERCPFGEHWKDFVGDPAQATLRFEAPLPSSEIYQQKVKCDYRTQAKGKNIRTFLPEVMERAGTQRIRFEGSTHADAIMISPKFSIVFEAKVTADVSHDVYFDSMRNQIARIIDVMLEKPPGFEKPNSKNPLSKRDPKRTIFVLVTPRMFQKNPHSRLYGWLMNDYMKTGESLRNDLKHRDPQDLVDISQRIGWLTWEDCTEILPGACGWLDEKSPGPVQTVCSD